MDQCVLELEGNDNLHVVKCFTDEPLRTNNILVKYGYNSFNTKVVNRNRYRKEDKDQSIELIWKLYRRRRIGQRNWDPKSHRLSKL